MHQATAQQTARNTAAAVLVLLGFYVLWQVRYVMILFFVAILIAAAIEPFMFKMRRIGARRSHSILAIYLLIVAGLTGFLIFLQQALLGEFDRLYKTLPDLMTQVKQWTQTVRNDFIRETLVSSMASFEVLQSRPKAIGGEEAYVVTMTLIESVGAFVTVFVVCYYWMAERGLLKRLLLFLAPRHRREQVTLVWDDIESRLGSWVRAQAILCLVVGLLSGIGYFVMGVKYSLLLGVIAAVTEMIPVVGPFIGAVPAIVIAITQGGVSLAVMVGLWAAFVQFIEGNILVPRVMGSNIGLTPLTVIFAMLVGFALMGIVGALLAIPMAAVVNVLLEVLVIREKVEGTPQAVELVTENAAAAQASAETSQLAQGSTAGQQPPQPGGAPEPPKLIVP